MGTYIPMSEEEENARADMKTIKNKIKVIYYEEINKFLDTDYRDNLPHIKTLYNYIDISFKKFLDDDTTSSKYGFKGFINTKIERHHSSSLQTIYNNVFTERVNTIKYSKSFLIL